MTKSSHHIITCKTYTPYVVRLFVGVGEHLSLCPYEFWRQPYHAMKVKTLSYFYLTTA